MKKILGCVCFVCAALFCCAQDLSLQVKLKDLQGKEIAVEDLLDSSPVVFCFWATWCKPCQNELDALTELKEKWEGKVKIVAVSIDDQRAAAKVRSLAKGRRWPFEVVQDVNQEFYKSLNLTSIPFSMIVKGKKIVYTHVGYSPGDEYILLKKVMSYIN